MHLLRASTSRIRPLDGPLPRLSLSRPLWRDVSCDTTVSSLLAGLRTPDGLPSRSLEPVRRNSSRCSRCARSGMLSVAISTFIFSPVVIVDDQVLEHKLRSLVEVLVQSKVVCRSSKACIGSRTQGKSSKSHKCHKGGSGAGLAQSCRAYDWDFSTNVPIRCFIFDDKATPNC